MDRENVFKKKTTNIIKEKKMSDNKYNPMNKTICFRDIENFAGATLQSCEPFNSSEEQLKVILNKKTKNTFYEWLKHDTLVKPYYDIDAFFVSDEEYVKHKKIDGLYTSEEHKKEISEKILNDAKEKLSKIFDKGELVISSSCGEKSNTWSINKKKTKFNGYAVSFHIVVAGYECKVSDLEKFNESVGLDKLTGYDKSVYSDGQNFRALYSSKPNDKRIKSPYNFETTPFLHLIQSTPFTNVGEEKLPASPPSSPPQSPKVHVIEEEEEEEVMEFKPIIEEKKYDLGKVKDILDNLTDDECYEYETWIKVGMAIHNITDGDEIGLAMFNDWSKNDEDNYDLKNIKKNWKYWSNKQSDKKVGFTFLKTLKEKYVKEEIIETSLESIFKYTWDTNYAKRLAFYEQNKQEDEEPPDRGMFVKGAIKSVLEKMNEGLIFVKETGEYIILDKKIIVKTDTRSGVISQKLDKCWYLKNTTKASDHYKKELFNISYQSQGKTKSRLINPFKEWCEWIDRREVRAIDFDPRDNCPKDIFNLWNGFHISKDDCHFAKEEDAKPVLDHILNSWCNGDKDHFEYVLNYFAHVLQKPYKKMGVLLALQSKEGGGKGFILDKMAQIIGDSHYCQNSNAKFLFGDFNGQLEGKILVNLDEAFWGGDKQLEGIVKNKITEQRQTINKKNKENYMISCFANYIITTNNAWFCGANADSRRMFCLKLNNFLSGIVDSDDKDKYIKSILDSPAEAFAKVLYNRDISEFNPRKFKKTDLLQNQVERNWNSVLAWWNGVIKNGGFTYENDFIEWGKLHKGDYYDSEKTKLCGIPIKDKQGNKHTAYLKSWIHSVYMSVNSDTRKFQDNRFWDDVRNDCLSDLYNEKKIQKKKERRIYLILPSLEDARKKWNVLQEYEYEYEDEDDDEFVFDDDGYDSDE